MISHVNKRLGMARSRNRILKRFKDFEPKIKKHLYPVVPTCIMSKTNRNKLQSFQNSCIRNIVKGTEDEDKNMEELHMLLKLDPVNIRLKKRADKTWVNFIRTNERLTETFITENNNLQPRDHNWWRRITPYILGDAAEPVYASRN